MESCYLEFCDFRSDDFRSNSRLIIGLARRTQASIGVESCYQAPLFGDSGERASNQSGVMTATSELTTQLDRQDQLGLGRLDRSSGLVWDPDVRSAPIARGSDESRSAENEWRSCRDKRGESDLDDLIVGARSSARGLSARRQVFTDFRLGVVGLPFREPRMCRRFIASAQGSCTLVVGELLSFVVIHAGSHSMAGLPKKERGSSYVLRVAGESCRCDWRVERSATMWQFAPHRSFFLPAQPRF
jgi:hypothetical protein